MKLSTISVLWLGAASTLFTPVSGQPLKTKHASNHNKGRFLHSRRQLQQFSQLCDGLGASEVPATCTADPMPSCWAARSPTYCPADHSFDQLIAARTTAVRSDTDGALASGFWFHLLEDKGAAYLLTATEGFDPPEIFCCVTDPNDLETSCSASLLNPVVIKSVDGHSGSGVYVFPDGVAPGAFSTELLTGTTMSLEDVVAGLSSLNPNKVIVEEFIGDIDGDLPTEYKFHMFDGQVGAIDVIANRGTGCDCYAVIDLECNRLDQQGCFENVDDGAGVYDSDGCTAINSGLGMNKAGPVKGNLPLCSALDVDPCDIAKLAEVAQLISSTIGSYIRVDMFMDNGNVRLQEYATNHMNGIRYCASKVDSLGCLDPCFLGKMWDGLGVTALEKLYGGPQGAVPAALQNWLADTPDDHCSQIMSTPRAVTHVSSPFNCTEKPTPSPVAGATGSTDAPTKSPKGSPTGVPTKSPTGSPIASPVVASTDAPTKSPTGSPTASPTTPAPTASPTSPPSSFTPTVMDISGQVFRDIDMTGTLLNGTDTTENLQDIVVTAYRADGTVAGNATVANDGTYELLGVFPPGPLTSFDALRVEFSGLPSWLQPGISGDQSLSSVQFHFGPTSTADFAVVSPSDDACGGYPEVAVPCFVNGNQSTGTMDTLVTFPSNHSGITQADKNMVAMDTDTGAVWGLAFERFTGLIWSSAYVKRHSGFGPGGISAIYITDPVAMTTTLFVDVNTTLGIDVGSAPSNADRGLAGLTDASHDDWIYTQVSKLGMGDIDYDEATTTLWIVNLFDRKLYGVENIDPYAPPTDASGVIDPNGWPLDTPTPINCVNGILRPFGIKIYEGKMYAGTVCSGELPGAIQDDVVAHILKMDLDNPNAGFEDVLSFAINYERTSTELATDFRDAPWRTWHYCDHAYPNVTGLMPEVPAIGTAWERYECFHPVISSLAFAKDGAMVIGVMDRFGGMMGPATYHYDPDGQVTQVMNRLDDPHSIGDTLHACWDGTTFTLEGDPVKCPSLSFAAISNTGVNGGEYYSGDWGPDIDKFSEATQGAVVYNGFSNEVISIAMDPEWWYQGGILWMDESTGTRNAGFMLYQSPNAKTNNGTFGKAAGLGDLELMCDGKAIEIGNYVWHDLNQDGIQDPNEPGLAGVLVELKDEESLETFTTTTGPDGTYYFNRENVPESGGGINGVKAFHDYTLNVPAPGGTPTATTPNSVSGTSTIPDAVDSDGIDVGGGVASVSFRTRGDNNNDHTYDFGFY